ncbi:copper oxidase [Virgibacillus phasianinus]|uniref:Copper oxidase n=1 Tax=Virgibacillus phasianinus TaxID=2017483 RepID=A0A220TZU4_9BACI|nr:multicopper oxidase family protein [Virgibacillus phasianinus]ASK61309.1 copper oxidase [Virgibacillus phasianinus]
MNKIQILIPLLLVVVLAACTGETTTTNENNQSSSSDETVSVKKVDTEGREVNEINITAQETDWMLNDKKMVNAWTYGGTIPGKEVRVTQGEVVKVNLQNKLPKPVTIHWHGYPVPNTEDGVAGVTQDAVPPGESYTYNFVATVPGTYWYHSHQNSVEQVDKGLYGVLIVEPKEGVNADRDYTLVLDEWQSNPDEGMDMGGDKANEENMNGMDQQNSGKGMDGMNHGDSSSDKEKNHVMSGMSGKEMMGHDMSSYDIFTINGKTYEANEPLEVKKGEKVKLRFINAGYIVHKIHIPVDYKITHVDGQPVNNPSVEKGSVLEIAPGERYDIAFTANSGQNFTIDDHTDMAGAKYMKIDVAYQNSKGNESEHPKANSKANLMDLGEKEEGQFSLDDNFDVEYQMDLGSEMDMEKSMGMAYTINGNAYPNVPPLKVEKGDLVKVKMTNKMSGDDAEAVHPMHLHGHFFQVLSKNGKTVKGSPIVKDTLNVKPGETYVIAFKADNPGNWLFHCHDLHHATAGMLQLVKYNNFEDFEPSGDVKNITE